MSLESMFQAALLKIQEHKNVVKDENFKPEEIIQEIKMAGGTSEEALRGMKWEEIANFLPTTKSGQKPILLAKVLAAIFRSTSEKVEAAPLSAKKVDRMTDRQLIENFDPSDHDNAVGRKLKARSNSEPFVVLNRDNTVNVEISYKLLKEIRIGHTGRSSYEVDGEIRPVYRVGETLENVADENPLYVNRILRPDGTCDQTNRSWDGVALEVRQLVRLAVQTGEIEVNNQNAHNIIDMAVMEDAWLKLSRRCQKAAVMFEKAKATGSLPPLKTLRSPQGRKGPFGQPKKVDFITSTWR